MHIKFGRGFRKSNLGRWVNNVTDVVVVLVWTGLISLRIGCSSGSCGEVTKPLGYMKGGLLSS